MEQSILLSTKKILGIGPDDDSFDLDVITQINSAFFTLFQLGVGPVDGFTIDDDAAVWANFLADDVVISAVKTYVWLKVRLAFDPPATSYLQTSAENQIREHEGRILMHREATGWVDPDPPSTEDEEVTA